MSVHPAGSQQVDNQHLPKSLNYGVRLNSSTAQPQAQSDVTAGVAPKAS